MNDPRLPLKVLFLDIDGVLNVYNTPERFHGMLGIDPLRAALVREITEVTGAKVVLSSTWRRDQDARYEVQRNIGRFMDWTIYTNNPIDVRGVEIQEWLTRMGQFWDITDYVVLDDMLIYGHEGHVYQTDNENGLTWDIAQAIIQRLK